jgi:hypothetical protein
VLSRRHLFRRQEFSKIEALDWLQRFHDVAFVLA